MPLPATSVLDASAVLAYVGDEDGAGAVEEAAARGSAVNLVNWSEVLTVVIRKGGTASEFEQWLTSMGILGDDGLLTLLGITADDARLAAELYPTTAPAGLFAGRSPVLRNGAAASVAHCHG